jgi:hypothetical protein
MERRGANTWIVAVLAIAVGFLAALLIVNNGSDNNKSSATVSSTTAATTSAPSGTSGTTTAGNGSTTTSSTTTTSEAAAPQTPPATVDSCIKLWNESLNRGDQVFLVNVASQQPVRIHVGVTSDVPPKCLITVVANNGKAYVFPEAGGTTYPYAQAPGATDASALPAAQKTTNALNLSDGTLKAS